MAELRADELERALAFVSKGVRGKRAQDRAKALLIFGQDGLTVQFNNLSANCEARISEICKYALNPFVLRPLLETYAKSEIAIAIDKEGIRIGRSRLAHIRVHGRFQKPDEAVKLWEALRNKQLGKRQKRIERKAESETTLRIASEDKLLNAQYVAFKRTDGGIEYCAAVLNYEKGEPGHRKVYVKTRDFQELWIDELEVVSYGKDPQFEI
jgi:hypothetical protein